MGRGTHLRRREAARTRRTLGQHERALGRAALAGRGGVRHAPVSLEEDVADRRMDGWRDPIRSLGGAGQVPGKSKGVRRPSIALYTLAPTRVHSRYRIPHHAAGPEPGRVHQGVRHPGHLHAVRAVVAVSISMLAPALHQSSAKTTISRIKVNPPGGTFDPSEAKNGLIYPKVKTGSRTDQSGCSGLSCDLTEGL